jgi:hypothetical protein
MAQLRLNTNPYYDDYDPYKKFYRVLFKPGAVVQARELTQLQTILQEQIRRFGSHVFKEGSVITGCAESHNFAVPYVKVLDTDDVNATVSTEAFAALEGRVVVGSTSGVRAKIKKIAAGSEGVAPDLKTLYVQYINGGSSTTATAFQYEEILTIEDSSQTLQVASEGDGALGFGSLMSLGDGVLYANGTFILHTDQTVVVDRYSSTPTKKVGFSVVERVVNTFSDPSLLDPARGSNNYTAPGADRYELSTTLTVINGTETIPAGFYLLFDVEDGVVKRRYDKTQYAQLGKDLARRTYDESGDYAVRPFFLHVREHLQTETNNGRYANGDPNLLVVGVEAGKAYVRGFEYETFSTENLAIDKGIDQASVTNQPVSTAYGNYIFVDNVRGPWTFNAGTLLNLRDNSNNVIGTARFQSLEYDSGDIATTSAEYRLYLFDVQMTDEAFVEVDNIAIGGTRIADAVPTGGTLTLFSSSFSAPIFNLPNTPVSETDDISFVYKKQFTNVSVNTDGTFSISLSGGETWAFTATDDLTVSREILVYSENGFSGGTLGTVSAGTMLKFTGGSRVVTYTSGTALNFALGDTTTGTPTVSVVVNVRRSAVPNSKTLRKNRVVTINTSTHTNDENGPWSLGVSDVFRIERVWMRDSSEAFPDIDLSVEGPNEDDWEDVTNEFSLQSNQKDGYYDYSFIEHVGSSNLEDKKLIVQFSFFEHSGSAGFYTVDSYPVPTPGDVTLSSQIEWYEIPTYTASTGKTYDLRNVVDFRSTVTAVSANVTAVLDATLNPSNPSASSVTFTPAILTPTPTEEMLLDVSHHLGRIDRVVLDADGVFEVVRGLPSKTPVRPRQPDNAMTIGFVTIPPFPSLSPYVAQLVGRPEYSTETTLVDNRRFTMKDIGDIHRRVNRLEQYTSLSFLEQATASLLIPNGDGENRFKNGILVDSFEGHNIGDVQDPDYRCSISNGEFRPSFRTENIDFSYLSTSTNVVRRANDVDIVVRIPRTGSLYAINEIVNSSSSASGRVEHRVVLAETTAFRWVRLYLNTVTGTFAENNDITGAGSGVVGRITYDDITSLALAVNQRPDLVRLCTTCRIVSLPYTHTTLSENPYASKFRNCVSQLLFRYDGSLTLDPPVDLWADMHNRPIVQSNPRHLQDNWVRMLAPWGTVWKEWENVWQGVDLADEDSEVLSTIESNVVESVNQRQEREGVSLTRWTNNGFVSVGSRYLWSSLLPYMRRRVITFTGTRLKPNQRVYAFFDGVPVSNHCKLSSAESYNTPLVTDANGNISGKFLIPRQQFSAGSKVFTLSDNATTPLSPSATTIASTTFSAHGVGNVEQGSVLSTLTPSVTITRQNEVRDVVANRQITNTEVSATDPIAQTFFVSGHPNGVFLSKLETYFKTKSLTSPITLEIREVVNGFPGSVIVPYSTVTLDPRDVNVSDDASAVTVFRFRAPVYLKNDTEYCFVLLPAGNDIGYNVWVSELGENRIGTTQRIDKQPNAGVLFVASNNNTWTMLPNEDIMFTIHRAHFTGSGTVRLKNRPIDYLKVDGEIEPGSIITQDNGTGTVVFFDDLRSIAHVEVTDGYFVPGPLDDGPTIISLEVVNIDYASPTFGVLDFNITELDWAYRGHSPTQVQMPSFVPISAVGTTRLSSRVTVFSHSTEVQTLELEDTEGSLEFEVTLTASADGNVSPIIDLNKVGCVVVTNDVTEDLTGEETSGGSAVSRYISRRVVLSDGQEAEDLRVYLTADIPAGTDIAVYAKMLSDTDPTPFADRSWTRLTKNAPLSTVGFNEYLYTIPSGNTNTDAGGLTGGLIYRYNDIYDGFKVFAIKIVPVSTTPELVPVARDFRAIALQS